MDSLSKFITAGDASALIMFEVEKTTNHHQAGENMFRAEANFHMSKVHIRAEASKSDLYAAIDAVKDELNRELSSKKSKDITLLKKGGQIIKRILKGYNK